MLVKYHYGLNAKRDDPDNRLQNCLDKNKIKYKRDEIILSFDIEETHTAFQEISEMCKSRNSSPRKEIVYSKSDIAKADYFQIYLKSYSGCLDDYLAPYDKSKICSGRCGAGKTQINPFIVKSEAAIEKKKIGGMFNVYDQIFVSIFVKECIEKSNLQGYAFCDVMKSKKAKSEKIFQFVFKNEFPFDLLFDIKERLLCQVCKTERYIVDSGKPIRYKSVSAEKDAVDFFYSKEYFGNGYSQHLMIVSKRAFEFFNKIGIKNLNYNPLFAEEEQFLLLP